MKENKPKGKLMKSNIKLVILATKVVVLSLILACSVQASCVSTVDEKYVVCTIEGVTKVYPAPKKSILKEKVETVKEFLSYEHNAPLTGVAIGGSAMAVSGLSAATTSGILVTLGIVSAPVWALPVAIGGTVVAIGAGTLLYINNKEE